MGSGRKFGFECEIVGGTRLACELLHDDGLIADPHLHHYHCSCPTCATDSRFLLHAQDDCTVEGEIVSRILEHGSDEADRAISGLSSALLKARAATSTAGGFHVHVDRRDLDGLDVQRVWRLFLRYQDDLADLASTRFDDVRSYNYRCSERDIYAVPWRNGLWSDTDEALLTGTVVDMHGSRGQWLWGTPYGTFEFRLWNATVAEWRMRLATGMSVAIVDAAKAGITVSKDDERPLEDVVGDFMDEPTWAGVIRQRAHKEVLVDA